MESLPFTICPMIGRIAMPISIKNNQTEILARKLAELTGESPTEAIRDRSGGEVRPPSPRTLGTFPCRRA